MKARTLFTTEMTQITVAEAQLSRTGGVERGIQMNLMNPTSIESGRSDRDMLFSNIAGVLPISERGRFERMLFRSTRGNCYVRFSDIVPKTDVVEAEGADASQQKSLPPSRTVFIIFYKSSAIEGKIRKICDAFNARRFDLVDIDRPQELYNKQEINHRELRDARLILDKNRDAKEKLCTMIAQEIESWLWTVRREKAVYHTLNMFKSDISNVLRSRAWILKNHVGKAKVAIARAHASLNTTSTAMFEKVPDQWPVCPTHFITNKYTVAFQDFVDTYGIPRYQEINPALFTAATFPFLFGVMYGDIGHGTCLALAGFYLICTEHQAEARGTGEMMKGIYVGRYMFFMMGLFAIYAGLIYNDYFSIGLNLYGTKYLYSSHNEGATAVLINGQYGDPSNVYPFGVDPAWKISENELLFYNSMKMKMSVILGIIQMIFGIFLRGLNALHFRSWLDFTCEFLPMIIFALAFFGYMVIIIFVKWSIDWNHRMALGSCAYDANGVFGNCNLGTSTSCYSHSGMVCTSQTPLADTTNPDGTISLGMCPLKFGGTGGGCQPPNLITTLINIALSPGNVVEPMYGGQGKIQTFLLLLAFICVPWLLLVKPLYLKYTHKPSVIPSGGHGSENPLLGGDDMGHDNPHGTVEGGHGGGHGEHGGEFNFGEIAIHQAIETIEFVLGMVSNTASYLRLWALSLAHTELATVFWEKAMVPALDTGNPVFIVVGYAVFACVTFGVLLAMDVLECFLHALRLHWVEFQNKFYKADGYKFQPFDFKAILSRANLE